MSVQRSPVDAGLAARLRLARTENVGPRTYRDLLRRFGGAAEAPDALPHLVRRGGREQVPPPDAAIRDEIAAQQDLGGRFVLLDDADYPPMLAEIDDPPAALAVVGDSALLARESIAVVGSRNASASGRRLAEGFARELGEAGFVVVSGLARGIDAAAHRGGLGHGTVAVLAGGVDHVYPPENAVLQAEIAARGASVSDQPLRTVPRAGHFPRRNRIAAGLCRATLVIEATETSGALITARLAAEAGRDVFAVPGSPLDPRARGCNRLIRDGPLLVESAADVIEALALELRTVPRANRAVSELSAGDEDLPGVPDEPPAGAHDRLLAALGPSRSRLTNWYTGAN